MIPIFSGRIFFILKREKMDSPTSNLSSGRTEPGFIIYVVSPETKEIIQYKILHFGTTFEWVINNLKKLGKPSNIFYYNGNTTQIKPTDKVSSYLPTRQSQAVFWVSSNQLEFPVVQPKENNILVLMITPDYEMLSFNVPGSTDINQLTSDYGLLVKFSDGNQAKIISGTLSENLPIRSNQIIFLLGESNVSPKPASASIINLIRTENIPMAGPTASNIIKVTLGNKVANLMEYNNRHPNSFMYINVSGISPGMGDTSMHYTRDVSALSVSRTFPIAYTTEDQYKTALKMMGLTDYYP